jgi:DNA-binding transcriptional ArsR family regulator
MVRHMPQRSPIEPSLATVFQALSDPTRLAVVERLSIGPASATELSRPFEMALPSFMQHLGVLERAGIVSSHKTGRTRVYQLVPDAFQMATAWLETFRSHWERRLDQLDQLLLAQHRNQQEQP